MSATMATESRVAVPRFAARVVLLIAAVVAVAALIASIVGQYWFDEAYMLGIGRYHLEWGSADQPPLTPALAAFMDWLAPGSVVMLRLPAVLATAGAVVVAGLIARELGGDARAQAITAGAQATTLWISVAGYWLTPYTLEPIQWLLILWLLMRWVRVRDDRLLLLMGVLAGIAAETKFQVLLLCALLLVSVLVCGPRELVRRPLLWAGAGAGAVVALPTLLWQALHGWPQLRMGAIVTSEADALSGGRSGLLVLLIAMAGVAGTALVLYGLWRLLRADELRVYRFVAVTFLAAYVIFVVTAGRPYYLGGLYGAVTAAGAVGLQRRREAGRVRGRWVVWPAFAASAAAAAGMLTVSVTGLSAESGTAGAGIAERTAAAYHALTPELRDRTVLMGQSYIPAAYLDTHSLQYDLPPAYSANRSYGYFPPPPEDRDTVLYVGSSPDEVRSYFTDVRLVAAGGPDARAASVWLCTGKTESWATLWPRLRHLTVSSVGQGSPVSPPDSGG